MPLNQSVGFSDRFFRQTLVAALQLNPFEELALPFLRGAVLDVGCGMGNLAFAATARGCVVPALDASAAAIEHIRSRAAAEGWPQVILADLRRHPIEHDYDCVVSIGLLMYFDCATALRVLADLHAHVRPGGHAVVNLLVQGTTYADMFDPQQHCLLAPTALQEHFAGWHIEYARLRDFAVPQGGPKRFATVDCRQTVDRTQRRSGSRKWQDRSLPPVVAVCTQDRSSPDGGSIRARYCGPALQIMFPFCR